MSAQSGAYKVAVAGVAATTGGAILGIANPEGADLIVTRLVLNVTTKSTGAANADIGIAAAATTSSDTLLDGVDVGTATGIFDNFDDQGTNGQSVLLWPDDQFLTITGSASTAGLVGNIYVEYMRV